ncbi:MAG: hydroxymethylbilane synthase [Verrucomicrobiae bacterium]|nr:hydroxymethylbilane synthase [Verrucomicrobiae bacterium]
MRERPLILGTRGSALALAQANLVRAMLHRAFPALALEIRIIKTTGDKLKTASLAASGTKGLFTRELEQALLRERVDLAVHSLKDLPTDLPAGLDLGAVPAREDARDALVAAAPAVLDSPGRVFTSSPRRALQAKLLWPECGVREIRGNLETRLAKIAKAREGDALLVAAAGLRRLGFLEGSAVRGTLRHEPVLHFRLLGTREMIPAPGQAAIGIEIRADDGRTRERLRAVHDVPTWFRVRAERAFLRAMGGGCAAPMAAHGVVQAEQLELFAFSGGEGTQIWRGSREGRLRDAEVLGAALAAEALGAAS